MCRAANVDQTQQMPAGYMDQYGAQRSTGRECRVCRRVCSMRNPSREASADHRRHRGRSRAYPHPASAHTSSSVATKKRIRIGLTSTSATADLTTSAEPDDQRAELREADDVCYQLCPDRCAEPLWLPRERPAEAAHEKRTKTRCA